MTNEGHPDLEEYTKDQCQAAAEFVEGLTTDEFIDYFDPLFKVRDDFEPATHSIALNVDLGETGIADWRFQHVDRTARSLGNAVQTSTDFKRDKTLPTSTLLFEHVPGYELQPERFQEALFDSFVEVLTSPSPMTIVTNPRESVDMYYVSGIERDVPLPDELDTGAEREGIQQAPQLNI